MDRGEGFIRYRARLRRWSWLPFFCGKRLSRHRWTYFEPEQVVPGSWWRRLLVRWAADDRMNEVEGTFDEVDWLPVSQWLLEEWRRAEVGARAAKVLERAPEVRRPAAEVIEAVAGEIRRVREVALPEPKMGEAACHVAKHLRIDRDLVTSILSEAGYENVRGENLDDLIKNGERRKGECRFCKLRR